MVTAVFLTTGLVIGTVGMVMDSTNIVLFAILFNVTMASQIPPDRK
jgi:hypothetical protein